jgi:hypothetical protein
MYKMKTAAVGKHVSRCKTISSSLTCILMASQNNGKTTEPGIKI